MNLYFLCFFRIGNCVQPNATNVLDELTRTLAELQRAIGKLKFNKSADGCEYGLAGELLQHAPSEFRALEIIFLRLNGQCPAIWHKAFVTPRLLSGLPQVPPKGSLGLAHGF